MFSLLQRMRMQYQPKLPKILAKIESLTTKTETGLSEVNEQISRLFPNTHHQQFLSFKEEGKRQHAPLKVGVVLSGGQAPGGHNVIAGLYDALKKLNGSSRLCGFLNGPSGIVENRYIEITEELLGPYRNQGGFDLIGSGRTKIETPEQFQAAKKTVQELDLDGLVIVGGDDSNTNAALLAEYFLAQKVKTRVIGVPKTIDGDLKNEYIETSFGFDTAAKTYSEIIGNILRDTLSAKKYYYFIKLMGRSASHITLECALQTHPNLAFIGEEVEAENKTLRDLTLQICDLVCERAKQGKDYGVILIPEGIVEFIPEFKILIQELNSLLAPEKNHLSKLEEMTSKEEKVKYSIAQLSPASAKCFESMPQEIQTQLLIDRDPHGNVQVSKIETERLFIEMVKKELKSLQKKGEYKGKFSAQPHFCGYEGRSCFPSNFDSQYCYALGYVAAVLIDAGATGYMSCVQNLIQPVEEWQVGGVPLVTMMHVEERHGQPKPVIRKALVNLDGEAFDKFKQSRNAWRLNDDYHYPGPIQFFGPSALTEAATLTLEYETSRKAFAQANAGDLE